MTYQSRQLTAVLQYWQLGSSLFILELLLQILVIFMYAVHLGLHSIFPVLNKGFWSLFLFKCFIFFKLLFSLLLFTTQVVLELEHSSDVIPFLRELVCLVYFLSSSAGRRANCQLDWHFLDLEKLNLQVRNYWFFIGIIGNRTEFCFIKQKKKNL